MTSMKWFWGFSFEVDLFKSSWLRRLKLYYDIGSYWCHNINTAYYLGFLPLRGSRRSFLFRLVHFRLLSDLCCMMQKTKDKQTTSLENCKMEVDNRNPRDPLTCERLEESNWLVKYRVETLDREQEASLRVISEQSCLQAECTDIYRNESVIQILERVR